MKYYNDKDYMENTCKDCHNRGNDKDYCCIVRRIDGTVGCPNEVTPYTKEKEAV